MLKFAADLAKSDIGPRWRALGWYYARRLHPALYRGAIRLTVRPATPGAASGRIDWRTTDDAREALRMFSPANPWDGYDLPPSIRTVVDLGANIGLSTLYWARRFPAARIVAVEMDPDNAARVRELIDANQLNAEVVQMAVAGAAGEVCYRRHPSHSRHRLEPGDTGGGEQVRVPAITLAGLLDHLGLDQVDLLKVDIEGAEQHLLDGVIEWASRVRVMLLELHHNIDYPAARKTVTDAGFILVGGDDHDRTELLCRR